MTTPPEICIHGHFYQPPRENPWLEEIEQQQSAYPWHDWNARIAHECYAPNATARILDGSGRIERIVNNYGRISFNIGPTLLAWMEAHDRATYEAILDADRESMKRFSGHGNAIAQAYNHMILPLATPRDRRTQVKWGIADFRRRFGRDPEGMWLPETAVDIDTLEVLAEHGLRFTLLSPHQAASWRRTGDRDWIDAGGGRIDPTRPYAVPLPSGRRIVVFFYDGPASRAVAFERLLNSGEDFANRLTGLFNGSRDWTQIVHIATDGETYGHHHRHGEMALAYALHHIETRKLATLTNYGEHLERHPPVCEARIVENTSWSCAHGVERWRSDCGCAIGHPPGWTQKWRGPLRDALDRLRDAVAPEFEREGGRLFKDAWAARDAYIDVIHDRREERIDAFLAAHGVGPLDPPSQVRALELMELQRHLQLMYTSCGWFFDDVSGIESVQVLRYAGRAVQLAERVFGGAFEEPFLTRLEEARSNLPAQGDARRIYNRHVRSAYVDLPKVGAHYAIGSLFEANHEPGRVYCYSVDAQEHTLHQSGRARLAIGHGVVTSNLTRASAHFTWAVLHMGDHVISGGVRPYRGPEGFAELTRLLREPFSRADLPETLRIIDRELGPVTYSLRTLFHDDQRRVLDVVLRETQGAAEAIQRQLYAQHGPLLRFLADLDMPAPRAMRMSADVVINADLRQALSTLPLNHTRIAALLQEAFDGNVRLDRDGLRYAIEETLERLSADLDADGLAPAHLRELAKAAELARTLPFDVDLWRLQNRVWSLRQRSWSERHGAARNGDGEAKEWIEAFGALATPLSLTLPESEP